MSASKSPNHDAGNCGVVAGVGAGVGAGGPPDPPDDPDEFFLIHGKKLVTRA